MTDSVVIPVKITLQVAGGGFYNLQGVQVTFQANGVNAAVCELAVGRNESDQLVVLDLEHGAEMKIVVQATFGEEIVNSGEVPFGTTNPNTNFGALIKDNKPFVLFNGVVDDWGPSSLQSGQFGIQVRCFGRLALLAAGTLHANPVISKSYLDTQVQFSFGQGDDDPRFLQSSEAFDAPGFSLALVNCLSRLATAAPTAASLSADSITAEVYNNFAADVNAAAAIVLSEIGGSLPWRDEVVTPARTMLFHFNEQLRSNWFYGSYLQSIIQLGEQLMYSIVETGEGIGLVPHHPFWSRANTTEITIGPETWSNFQWVNDSYENYAGVVLTASGGSEATDPGAGESLILGLGKISEFRYGRVHVGPAPAFMVTSTDSFRTGGNIFARAIGDVNTVRPIYGDLYAQIKALELNFASRRCRVSSPCVRTDIGPLSAVQVQFPDIPEVNAGSGISQFGVYGTVQAVTIAIDASRNYAQTTFDIGYVRSLSQQSNIIDRLNLGHPFFQNNYTGNRLDAPPYEETFTIGGFGG